MVANPRVFCFAIVAAISFSLPAAAQVTNLYVNGSDAYFTMTSGDSLGWAFELPAGGTADIEVWIDVDGDTAIDPLVDRLLTALRQIDGLVSDEGGVIPDFDFVEDGAIHFGMEVGLAPAKYMMNVSNSGVGQTVGGEVVPLASPSFTISGTVSGPPGADLSFLLLDLSRDGPYAPEFWNALTDSVGHYTLEMNDDTAGNPWWLSIQNPPRGYLLTRAETTLTITGHHTGVDFELAAAAAQVSGAVLDENGDSLQTILLTLERMDPGWAHPVHWVVSDHRGAYWAGALESELNGSPWRIAQPYTDQPTTTHMLGMRTLSPFTGGMDLVRDITVYETNTAVSGRVLLNGVPPGFEIMLFAQNDDTARAWAKTDPLSGTFSIPVSDRISQYFLHPYNLVGPYFVPVVPVAPGDTGVVFEVLLVDVDEEKSGIPAGFSLSGNYPNPFNPATVIEYSLPVNAHVNISVYDILGRSVAVLRDGVEEPGYKTVAFDGSDLPGGIYIYTIRAGGFTDVKKMVLMK